MRRPHIIAEQARDARGPLGWIVATIMARETWAANRLAADALAIGEADQILDVGCGHGRGLAALAARAPGGWVVGIDPSELMVDIARRRNRRLTRAGRVQVTLADADALPFQSATFDRALCVHVIYFWEGLDASLREIARVLKPGGRLALVFRTSADASAVSAFPSDVYRFPALNEVTAALGNAGFVVDGSNESRDAGRPGPILLVAAKQDGGPGA